MNNAIIAKRRQCLKSLHRVLNQNKVQGKIQSYSRGARYLSFGVRLSDPMQLSKALKLGDNVALVVGAKAVIVHRKNGEIQYQFQLRQRHWKTVTRDDVSGVQIGISATGQPVMFTTHDYHSLFAGSTKSGKSTAIQSTLCGLAESNTVDEIGFYIIDPHNDYEVFSNIAHLESPVASDRTSIRETIEVVYNLFTNRKETNDRNSKKVYFVIDEMQSPDCLGSKESGLNRDAVRMVSAIAKGGGKFNISLICGTQRPSQGDLPGIIDMLLSRYIGKVDSAQTSAFLSGQTGVPGHLLTGYGDFFRPLNGDVVRFQVAKPLPQHIDALEKRYSVTPLQKNIMPVPKETQPIGRGASKLEPVILAHYLSSEISISQGKEQFGIGRHVHNRYKSFADRVNVELERL